MKAYFNQAALTVLALFRQKPTFRRGLIALLAVKFKLPIPQHNNCRNVLIDLTWL